MNFDHLKEAWNDESGSDFKVPQKIENLKVAQQPVDRIKKNMKHELFAQFIGIALIGIFPVTFKIAYELLVLYYALYALMLIICAYYLVKFYIFFKEMNHSTLSSKENLYELYYEIRLKIETYKSFSYILMPFSILFCAILIFGQDTQNFLNKLGTITNANMIAFFVLFSAIVILITVMTNWWVNYYYGKYVKQIKNVLDELKDEV